MRNRNWLIPEHERPGVYALLVFIVLVTLAWQFLAWQDRENRKIGVDLNAVMMEMNREPNAK